MLTVGSLFAGIGGFDLGLERAGMRVLWQSEIDPYASAVLRKHWPEVPNHGDIRSISAAGLREYDLRRSAEIVSNAKGNAGKLQHGQREALRNQPSVDGAKGGSFPDVLCGGFPCQPFSYAGRRAGANDDRHLWPEMCRVIGELRPAWVIGENVAGIISMELDQVLSDLEALGYATRTFVIPAVAVDAPHRRDRCWIIACDRDRDRESAGAVDEEASGLPGDVADADDPRSQGRVGEILRERADECATGAGGAYGRTSHWPPEPDVGRVAHGIPSRVDRLRCLGNAIVPQIAEVIGRAIIEADT